MTIRDHIRDHIRHSASLINELAAECNWPKAYKVTVIGCALVLLYIGLQLSKLAR